jgi:hypothetical protein
VPADRPFTTVKWLEFALALPATALAADLVMLGSGAVAGLVFAAIAHVVAGDRDGLASDVTVLVWLGGSILGAAWGVAALWLATFCSEHALRMSPRLRWFVILGLIVGVATAVYWLSSRYSVRDSPLYVYPPVMASLAGLRNLFVLALRRSAQ